MGMCSISKAGSFLARGARWAKADDAALCAEVCRLFSVDAVDLVLTGEGTLFHTSASAAPSPLMRYQARENFPVANRWHELIDLTPEGRAALADPAQKPSEAALQQAGLLV